MRLAFDQCERDEFVESWYPVWREATERCIAAHTRATRQRSERRSAKWWQTGYRRPIERNP